MRTLHAIVGCLVFGIALTTCAEPNFTKGFVRDPGTFTLNDSGAIIEVSHSDNGRLSCALIWRIARSGNGVSSSGETRFAIPDFFKQKGWFLYVESSSRVWIFDGLRQFDVIHRREGHTGRYSAWNEKFREDCPPEVWKAIPEKVRSEMLKQVKS